jgi:ketosteroid isomerase-like protein
MKKLIVLLFIASTITSFAQTAEVEEVKKVILDGYVNGAFNGLDADAMRKTFHEDFAIYSTKGTTLDKYPIGAWADGTAKRKAKEDFDPAKNKWEHKFASVDVTGNAAAVKVELSRNGKQVYTDYLSLLKFEDGWRIVAKVYHQHGK